MELPPSLAFSRYATAALAAHPHLADELAARIDAPFDWAGADAELARLVAAGDPEALDAGLRRLRRRVLLHTIARDLDGRADLAEVCTATTRLAEASLRAALTVNHRALVATCGEPRGTDGRPQALVIIGMGKLGGGELNVSSDIDLVFTYPEEGETDGARALSNREFFDRLGRRVIASLDDLTPEGFVYRVDMRLRPYGDSGPLTAPYGALEQYLITQGRAWERYAWLKARFLTGARHDELDEIVQPFVYRKYLDYDAYEGLRDIHRQIREQVKRRDYQPNIKLGPGGIREIEFTVQALQLVRGGREPGLRQRGTLPALAALGARGLLPESAVGALHEAYVFLRNLEHRLQYRDDQQTQTLPAAGPEREALALAMGFARVEEFEAALAGHRANVEEHFAAVFGDPSTHVPEGGDATADDDIEARLAAVWRGDVGEDAAVATLDAEGFADAAALAGTLERVRSGARYLQLPVLSRQRFDALLPQLLHAATTVPVHGADAHAVFMRLLALLEAVSRRSAYLALLIEHPPLLPRLAQLMGGSAWAADFLTRHPLLLDELLDARVLLAEPDWDAWRAELARMLADHADDPEARMDVLRHFKHTQTFRLLAQDIAGLLTVERLADHLSALADTILAATLGEVWALMVGDPVALPRFAIIGYGRLGGKELGYVSDLDLVFLYEDEDERAPVRYTRLAQRMVTWLTSTTAAGPLYDIDLRLRPDGAAGLLVLPFPAFRRYQREKAWTWEHQALTRARFVAGDAGIGAAFEAEREAILRLPRELDKLRTEVVEMRHRMFDGHPNPTPQFDLKHDPGGMVDIEFAVQYLVLAHAHAHPELTRNLGNIALLGTCGELGLVPPATAADAADAYRQYRRLQHEIRLTGAAHARVPPPTQTARRAVVAALWLHVFGAPWAHGGFG